jgi:small GTP-binding protein
MIDVPVCEAKVVFLGDSAVGKTSIITAYSQGECPDEHAPTVGANFSLQRIKIDNEEVKLKIWDTAGQERFRALTPMYYRDSQVAVLVFAVNSNESFQGLSSWLECLKRDTQTMPAIILAGNKVDLDHEASTSRGEELAQQIGAVYVECSAKTRTGIEELFVVVARKALENRGIRPNTARVQAIMQTKQSTCC